MAAKKKNEDDTAEAAQATENTAPEAQAPAEDKGPQTEAERKALRLAKRAQRPEALPAVWVRYNLQPGTPAGPVAAGPFPARLDPSKRITLYPDQWTKVDGVWAASLQASSIAYMFDVSATEPKP